MKVFITAASTVAVFAAIAFSAQQGLKAEDCLDRRSGCVAVVNKTGVAGCLADYKLGGIDCCYTCAGENSKDSSGKVTETDANRRVTAWLTKLQTALGEFDNCVDQKMRNGTSYTKWCETIKKTPTAKVSCSSPSSVRVLCMKTCEYCIQKTTTPATTRMG